MKKILPFFIFALLIGGVKAADAASCDPSQIRWSSTSNTIYVTGAEAVCTLTDLDTLVPKASIEKVDPANNVWFLGTTIRLQQGATLNLHGSSAGGDVNELRLRSNSGQIVYIQANWGTVDIQNTKILSWDESKSGPDTDYSNQRAYIQVRSFLEGDTPRESRMNIHASDIGYLGFYGAEAYGLSWKVNVPDMSGYDKVDVFGDVTDSRIHHNYFGAYTFGAFGMQWKNNEFDNNAEYGLDPHDNSDQLVIENNEFHHNGNHGLICSRFCDHLTIRNNVSHHNKGNGIMLHRATNDSLVEQNQLYGNGDSGIAIFDSHNNTIQNNKSWSNNNGIRFSVGSSNNTILNNEFKDNLTYGIYFYKGTDAPLEGDGRPKNNTFEGNTVSGSGDYGLKLKEADGNTFKKNTFSGGHRDAIVIEAAQNNTFITNTLTGNTGNYYYPKNGATGIAIKDTPIVPIKFVSGATSDATLSDSNHAIFDNAKNLPTVADATKSSLKLTPSTVGSSTVTFTALPLMVTPASADVKVTKKTWTSTKQWTVAGSTTGMAVTYTVGGLTPGASYKIMRNSTQLPPKTASGSGVITFTDTFTGTATFTVAP